MQTDNIGIGAGGQKGPDISVEGFLILIVCSTKPLLGHHALVRVVGFRMAGFMLSGSGIRVCVLGNVELGWGGWGKVQFNVGG